MTILIGLYGNMGCENLQSTPEFDRIRAVQLLKSFELLAIQMVKVSESEDSFHLWGLFSRGEETYLK